MIFFRRVLPFALALLACLVAHAHEPLESTGVLRRDAENLEVAIVLSNASALNLLPAEDRPARLDAATFAPLHERYLAAAAKVCTLLDASGSPLPAVRVLVSLNRDHEVYYHLLFDPATQPAALRLDYLATQPAGAFCEMTDERPSPARHFVLRQDQPALAFAAPASAPSIPAPSASRQP